MELVLGDIVHMQTDAIVCPAHSDLRPAPGIREAVFRAADAEKLQSACRKLGRCPIGKAVLTPGFGLNCRYLIHVAGPGWYSGSKRDRQLFERCYLQALHKAWTWRCRSLALPLMFSGAYHLPRAEALVLVCQTVTEFERTHPGMQIQLVLYKPGIYHLAEKIYAGVMEGTIRAREHPLIRGGTQR